MSTENTLVETPNVEPVVATENQTTEAPENEEVAQPETAEGNEPQKPELTPAEKEAKALKRRVDRLTRERYRDHALFEIERQQFQRPVEQTVEASETTKQPPALTEESVQRRARELVEVQNFNQQCNDVATKGKAEFKADFDSAMRAIADEGVQLIDARGKPTSLMTNVLESDVPHKVLHYLGMNPDVAAELMDLSPPKQARRLVQIETELTAPPKRSNAPAPLDPIRGSGRASGEPDPKDTNAWVAWRNKQVSRR